MYFSEDKRPGIKAKNPDMKFGEIQKVIGAAWTKQTTEETTKWLNMAMKDKERFNQEMLDYKNHKNKMKENESSPPNDKDTKEKGPKNNQTTDKESSLDSSSSDSSETKFTNKEGRSMTDDSSKKRKKKKNNDNTAVQCTWSFYKPCDPILPSPLTCNKCSALVHHLCQINWENEHSYEPPGCAKYCPNHHTYYQQVVSAGSRKKSSKESFPLPAAVAESSNIKNHSLLDNSSDEPEAEDKDITTKAASNKKKVSLSGNFSKLEQFPKLIMTYSQITITESK